MSWVFRLYDDQGRLFWQRPLRERCCRHCRAKTALVHPYCAACLPLALRVELRPSSIPGAGLGLFASDPGRAPGAIVFRRGERIAPYLGEPLSDAGVARRYFAAVADPAVEWVRAPYLGRCRSGRLDAALFRGPAAYCNDVRGSRFAPNARLKLDRGGAAWARALRPIADGEEIFVSYGPTYWSSFALAHETVFLPVAAGTRPKRPDIVRNRRAAKSPSQKESHMKSKKPAKKPSKKPAAKDLKPKSTGKVRGGAARKAGDKLIA